MSCTSCPTRASRRRFLGQVSGGVVVAVAGALPGDAFAAFPIHEVLGAVVTASERRYPIPPADAVTVDRDAQVFLVRAQQKVFAFALSCPHENTALRWRAGDGRFQCPRHESKYGTDGTFLSGRATRNMDRLPIRRDGASVVVNVDAAYQSDRQPAEWAAAAVTL